MLAIGNAAIIQKADVNPKATEVENDKMYAPPCPPPKEWAQWLIQQLEAKMYEILCANKVPYFILKGFADEDWGDISLLLTRWPDTSKLYSDADDTLDINIDVPTYVRGIPWPPLVPPLNCSPNGGYSR